MLRDVTLIELADGGYLKGGNVGKYLKEKWNEIEKSMKNANEAQKKL